MDQNKSLLERAFDLAASGKVKTLGEIRHALKVEGYQDNQLSGPALSKQLRELIRRSQKEADRT
jgi:hypothetical protein